MPTIKTNKDYHIIHTIIHNHITQHTNPQKHHIENTEPRHLGKNPYTTGTIEIYHQNHLNHLITINLTPDTLVIWQNTGTQTIPLADPQLLQKLTQILKNLN